MFDRIERDFVLYGDGQIPVRHPHRLGVRQELPLKKEPDNKKQLLSESIPAAAAVYFSGL